MCHEVKVDMSRETVNVSRVEVNVSRGKVIKSP